MDHDASNRNLQHTMHVYFICNINRAYRPLCEHMRAFAYDASAYNASICEHMRIRAFASHCMWTHFSCVMRAFAYVIWASSVSVMCAYARICMRCERIRIACACIRIACARIACECAHWRGTYACPVLYISYHLVRLSICLRTILSNCKDSTEHMQWICVIQ